MSIDDAPQLDSWSSLILIMIYEFLLGEKSNWKPYFDVLPTEFDTPMFWSEEELKHLQASATVNKIGKDSAEEMFKTLLIPAIRGNESVFEAAKGLSDEELVQLAHRMGSTIMAYAFDLENEDEENEDEEWVEDRDGKSLMGMVPMADIMNADAEFNVCATQSLTYTKANGSGTRQPRRRRTNSNVPPPHQSRRPNPQLLRPPSQL